MNTYETEWILPKKKQKKPNKNTHHKMHGATDEPGQVKYFWFCMLLMRPALNCVNEVQNEIIIIITSTRK